MLWLRDNVHSSFSLFSVWNDQELKPTAHAAVVTPYKHHWKEHVVKVHSTPSHVQNNNSNSSEDKCVDYRTSPDVNMA